MKKKCPECKYKYRKVRNKNSIILCPNCGYKEIRWTINKIKQLIWDV